MSEAYSTYVFASFVPDSDSLVTFTADVDYSYFTSTEFVTLNALALVVSPSVILAVLTNLF